MKAKWMLTLMVATATASGVALAEGTDAEAMTDNGAGYETTESGRTLPEGRATFNTLDQNDDEMISMDEAQENEELFSQFDDMDADDDDLLDEGEFAQFETEPTGSGDYPDMSEDGAVGSEPTEQEGW